MTASLTGITGRPSVRTSGTFDHGFGTPVSRCLCIVFLWFVCCCSNSSSDRRLSQLFFRFWFGTTGSHHCPHYSLQTHPHCSLSLWFQSCHQFLCQCLYRHRLCHCHYHHRQSHPVPPPFSLPASFPLSHCSLAPLTARSPQFPSPLHPPCSPPSPYHLHHYQWHQVRRSVVLCSFLLRCHRCHR